MERAEFVEQVKQLAQGTAFQGGEDEGYLAFGTKTRSVWFEFDGEGDFGELYVVVLRFQDYVFQVEDYLGFEGEYAYEQALDAWEHIVERVEG